MTHQAGFSGKKKSDHKPSLSEHVLIISFKFRRKSCQIVKLGCMLASAFHSSGLIYEIFFSEVPCHIILVRLVNISLLRNWCLFKMNDHVFSLKLTMKGNFKELVLYTQMYIHMTKVRHIHCRTYKYQATQHNIKKNIKIIYKFLCREHAMYIFGIYTSSFLPTFIYFYI